MAKSKGMTREEAAELYQDLRKAMGQVKSGGIKKGTTSKEDLEMKSAAKTIAATISKTLSRDGSAPVKGIQGRRTERSSRDPIETLAAEENADAIVRMRVEEVSQRRSGPYAAILFVLIVAGFKATFSLMEAAGVLHVPTARATVDRTAAVPMNTLKVSDASMKGFSKEEVHILTSLDQRRVELEERARKLDDRETDLSNQEKTFAAKLTQLRDLTDQLKGERLKNEKKRNAQLDQLANVYGSMAPQEAATLMEQLDITIALSLLERMPEKRIGQILALMHPERALTMTRMLSGKATP